MAALQARALRAHLRRGAGLRGAQTRVTAASRSAWVTARAADLALPGTPGDRSPTRLIANAYLARVLSAAARDAAVATGFLRVTGLIDRPSALFRPRILLPAIGPRSPWPRPHDSARRRVPVIGLAGRLAAATLLIPAATAVGLIGITIALRQYLRTRHAR